MTALFRFFCSNCGAQCTSDTPHRPTCTRCQDGRPRQCKPIDRQDKRNALPHPMQPVEDDGDSVIRFKQNAIVRFLMEFARDRGTTLNELHCMPFSAEDWNQFSQLTGYSVSGFGDLSYAAPELVEAADEAASVVSKRMAEEERADNEVPLGNVTWIPRETRS